MSSGVVSIPHDVPHWIQADFRCLLSFLTPPRPSSRKLKQLDALALVHIYESRYVVAIEISNPFWANPYKSKSPSSPIKLVICAQPCL